MHSWRVRAHTRQASEFAEERGEFVGEALRREIMNNVAYPPFPDPLSHDVFSGNVPRTTVRTEGQGRSSAASPAAASCACVHEEGR